MDRGQKPFLSRRGMGVTMATLLHLSRREGQRSWPPSHLPSGNGMRMTTSPSSLQKMDGGDHGHTHPLLKRRMAEVNATFPSSFWKWDEDCHDLCPSPLEKGMGLIVTLLPFLSRDWRRILWLLPCFQGCEGGHDLCPSPPTIASQLPSGSGMGMTKTTLFHFPRREGQKSWPPSHLPSGIGMRMTKTTLSTPPLPENSKAEVMATFPPSFWNGDEDDHDHAHLPTFPLDMDGG